MLPLDLAVVLDLLVGASFALAAVFTAMYLTMFNWRKTAGGRALVFLIVAMLLTFLSDLLVRLLGTDYPGREVISVVLWLSPVAALVNLIRVLVKNLYSEPELFERKSLPK